MHEKGIHILKHIRLTSKQFHQFQSYTNSEATEATEHWVCRLIHTLIQFFCSKSQSLIKKGAKQWVCSCTPCTPASAVPVTITVELGFKNRQNRNLLDFKKKITNYQLVIYVVNYSQDKNILDFKNQNGSDRKSS